MNTLFVLLDGAEDHANPELGGKKPLDVANMPFIKSNVKTYGKTSGKEYTHIFLNEFFTGHPPKLPRAVLEALGLGMNVKDGRAAFRLSPAHIHDDTIEWSYHAYKFADKLEKAVRDNLHILEKYNPEIKFFISSRAVITMDYNDIPELPGPPVPVPYVKIPGDLGKFVEAIMEDMDGITDYPWGCGKFTEQYPAFDCLDNLFALSNSPTSLGICASLGYDISMIDNLDERFPIAKEALKKGNVFLHMDEVDEYSHMKDPQRKIEILEHIDKMMEKYFSDAERIVYFIDHGTSSMTGEHLPIEVPFWTNFETNIENGEFVPLSQVVPKVMDSNHFDN